VGFNISFDADNLGELDDAGEVQIGELFAHERQNLSAVFLPISLQIGIERRVIA
jgi:hypothetical protein